MRVKEAFLNTRKLVLASVFCAATVVLTRFVSFPVGGIAGTPAYIHPGDAVIFLSAFMLGPLPAAAIGGISGVIADVTAGAAIYALPTLIIKAAMAFAAGHFMKKSSFWRGMAGMLIGAAIMCFGYFIFEYFFFNPAAAIAALPFNLIQAAFGIAAGSALIAALRKHKM